MWRGSSGLDLGKAPRARLNVPSDPDRIPRPLFGCGERSRQLLGLSYLKPKNRLRFQHKRQISSLHYCRYRLRTRSPVLVRWISAELLNASIHSWARACAWALVMDVSLRRRVVGGSLMPRAQRVNDRGLLGRGLLQPTAGRSHVGSSAWAIDNVRVILRRVGFTHDRVATVDALSVLPNELECARSRHTLGTIVAS